MSDQKLFLLTGTPWWHPVITLLFSADERGPVENPHNKCKHFMMLNHTHSEIDILSELLRLLLTNTNTVIQQFKITRKKTPNSTLMIFVGESTAYQSPHKGPVMWGVSSWHEVIIAIPKWTMEYSMQFRSVSCLLIHCLLFYQVLCCRILIMWGNNLPAFLQSYCLKSVLFQCQAMI